MPKDQDSKSSFTTISQGKLFCEREKEEKGKEWKRGTISNIVFHSAPGSPQLSQGLFYPITKEKRPSTVFLLQRSGS